MAAFEIPFTPGGGNQTFALEINATTYRIALNWRAARAAGWTLDISDPTGDVLVSGIPLVTGADLLAPYRHLGLGAALYVRTDGDPDVTPTFDSLGRTSRLIWETAG